MLEACFYDQIEDIVREAGRMIKEAAPTASSVHQKEGLANFVTNFDLEIQCFLIQRILELLPAYALDGLVGFYGEEETEGNHYDGDTPYVFYIDPIDGTTNFIFGYEFSCVSVGLAYEGAIIAGFVYNPYTDTMYRAVRGEGASANGRVLSLEDKPLEEGIVAFGCARYNEGDTDLLFTMVKKLYLRSLAVRNGGSAALDLCRVAAGASVVYFELKLQPYDYAAASVIIEEAGGVIGQMDGSRITLDRPCSILAGTRTACEEVRRVCEEGCLQEFL